MVLAVLAGVAVSTPDRHQLLSSGRMISETLSTSFVRNLRPCSTCAHTCGLLSAWHSCSIHHLCVSVRKFFPLRDTSNCTAEDTSPRGLLVTHQSKSIWANAYTFIISFGPFMRTFTGVSFLNAIIERILAWTMSCFVFIHQSLLEQIRNESPFIVSHKINQS